MVVVNGAALEGANPICDNGQRLVIARTLDNARNYEVIVAAVMTAAAKDAPVNLLYRTNVGICGGGLERVRVRVTQ